VPQEQLVDELFKEIDKYARTKRIDVDAAQQAAGTQWLERIEEENAGELTPERIAQMEAEAAEKGEDITDPRSADREPADVSGPELAEGEPYLKPVKRRPALDEEASPVAGRRFTRT